MDRGMSLHLLVVNVHFAPHSYGGATLVAEAVARHLVHDHGMRVSAVSAVQRDDMAEYAVVRAQVGGIDSYLLNLPAARSYVERYRNGLVDERLAALIGRIAPDLVHLHCLQDLGAGLLSEVRRAGLPAILSLHDFWWLCERQFMIEPGGGYCGQSPVRIEGCRGCVDDFGRAARRMQYLRDQAALADVVTYPSRFARDLSEASGLAPGRGIVWANGVRPPGAGFARAQAARRAADPTLVFGYLGGPSRIKGWPDLRAAWAEVAHAGVRLELADGSLAGDWYAPRSLADLPGDLRVHPRFGPDGMDDFYAGIDVLLFPSQWKETFGLVLREAFARGLRVIRTRGGGAEEHGGRAREAVLPIGAGPQALADLMRAEIARGRQDLPPLPVTTQAAQAAQLAVIARRLVHPVADLARA